MKVSRQIFLAFIIVFGGTVYSAERPTLSKDALNAFMHGARLKETLRIVDSVGWPVADANVRVGLEQGSSGKVKVYSGTTDTNGSWTVEGTCSRFANYRISKDGYYETYLEKHMFSVDYADVNRRVKDGRWEPWNPTVKIVLKERRDPTPLVAKGGKYTIPVSENPVGFNFLIGEVLATGGTGSIADLLFQYSFQTTNDTGHCKLTLSAVNPDDGMIVLKNDGWSRLKTIYEAPLDGYLPSISFERDWTGRTFSKREELGAEAYIVFRCRTKRDAEDNLTSAHYGILYGPLDFGRYGKNDNEGMMVFRSTFNPTPNDRNLEWDGSGL